VREGSRTALGRLSGRSGKRTALGARSPSARERKGRKRCATGSIEFTKLKKARHGISVGGAASAASAACTAVTCLRATKKSGAGEPQTYTFVTGKGKVG